MASPVAALSQPPVAGGWDHQLGLFDKQLCPHNLRPLLAPTKQPSWGIPVSGVSREVTPQAMQES